MSLTHADLRRAVAALFEPAEHRVGHRIGAEIEWIPVDAVTRRPVPISDDRGTLELVRAAGADHGWLPQLNDKGLPIVVVPGEGCFTFEPGGQLEFSAHPEPSVEALVARLAGIHRVVSTAASARGIDLLAVGLDPETPPSEAPMLLDHDRYRRMAAHFARQGPAGARMMRQTASLQIALDLGDATVRNRRWELCNALAPVLTAMFANAPIVEGAAAGVPSARAITWRALDSSRTGLAWGTDAIDAYLDFALGAEVFLLDGDPESRAPFAGWIARGATHEDWLAHLTTLFPEVRPRGYLEIRTVDALPIDLVAAPLALVALLTADANVVDAALQLTGEPSRDLLYRASYVGLADPELKSLAIRLGELAASVAAERRTPLVGPESMTTLEAFLERYTRVGRAPADDMLARLAPA